MAAPAVSGKYWVQGYAPLRPETGRRARESARPLAFSTVEDLEIGLIADDLTGACDSGVPFLRLGRVVVSFWPSAPDAGAACAALTTESRAAPPDVALERSESATAALLEAGAGRLYRKVDSMARGNLAADVRGAMAATGFGCVLAPALPGEGRATVGGVQRWPGGECDLVALLSSAGIPAGLGRPSDARPGSVVVCDASSQQELERIAAELTRLENVLPAGTAGLAAELATAHAAGRQPPAAGRWPRCDRVLAVVGTPAARHQAEHARGQGMPVLELGPGEVPPDLSSYDGVLMTGGETAARVLHGYEAQGIELVGELLPRVPVGLVRGGRLDRRPVALKAGAFGTEETIARALLALQSGGPT